jgi:hypothetical protein
VGTDHCRIVLIIVSHYVDHANLMILNVGYGDSLNISKQINNNTVSVMQPYVFPYIGYFNLCHASDIFVFYDDVNYIKQGWINRNRILVNKCPYAFSIPLKNGSSFELIGNVAMSGFDKYKVKFLEQIEQSYCKAKFFKAGRKYVENVLNAESESISRLAIKSVVDFFELVDIERRFLTSSEAFSSSRGIDRADRLIEIVKSLGSSRYVNPLGGAALYDRSYFNQKGVKLYFVKSKLIPYTQVRRAGFVAGLSIIDVIMNNSVDDIRLHLKSYKLV